MIYSVRENIMSSKKYYAKFICDLCGHERFERKIVVNKRFIVSCYKCKMISCYPMPEEGEIRAMYEDENYFEAPYFTAQQEERETVHSRYMKEAAKLAEKHCYEGGRLLEIGPGQGHFLQLCLSGSIHYEGLDISSKVVYDLHNRFGVHMYQGIIEDGNMSGNLYKVITAFDVIEHSPSPKRWLQCVYESMENGGLLILSTVNVANLLYMIGHLLYKIGIKGPVSKLYPPYHLNYFTPEILEHYLTNVGFSDVRICQENYDYWKATSNLLEQFILRMIYLGHNLTGNKTNLYAVAHKPLHENNLLRAEGEMCLLREKR